MVKKIFFKYKFYQWILLVLLVLFLGGGLATFFYSLHVAQQVTDQMNGKLWSLPSRVYGAPMILYPGGKLQIRDLQQYLTRKGYRKVRKNVLDTGEWSQQGNRFLMGQRGFRRSSSSFSSQQLEIILEENHISSLRTISKEGKENFPPTVMLEPELIGEFFGLQREQRRIVRLDQVPKLLIQGILGMEDRNFYHHHGFSLRGTFRAIWRNFRKGKISQGGSTLTQQLMKNLFLTPERTFSRKIREAIMTAVMEILYSKDQILEAYINEIYLGQEGSTSIHGFEEAARFYFSKTLKETSLSEQALLAGLISSPGLYSPYNSLSRSKERRNLVLQVLFDRKEISLKDYQQALQEPLQPRGKQNEKKEPFFFMDYVSKEMSQRFSSEALREEGLEIHTTLDPFLQASADKAVFEGLSEIDARMKNPEKKVEIAFLAVHPQTGSVKAMLGGRNFKSSQFNRVLQAKRQTGSAIKPFVVASAFSEGLGGEPPSALPSSVLEDQPTTFLFSGQEWSPKNYDDKYGGQVTVRTALEKSLNVAFVNLASKVGLPKLVFFFSEFGFSNLESVPSLALGTMEVSPWELTRAYTALANGGLRTELQGVSEVFDSEGHRLDQRSLQVKRVVSEEVAFLVTNLLKGVVEEGTARSIGYFHLKGELAGKTGTTTNFRDNWFVGYSPNLLVTVWVGYDDETPVGFSGASTALQLWIKFMKEALPRLPDDNFLEPQNIHWVEINRELGCKGGKESTWREAFLKGTEPPPCPK